MRPFQEHSFKLLFETNSKKVFNISLNIVQHVEDAEDITQEVFIEVYRSMKGFNEKSDISTWIYRIAVNKSLDFIKAKKRKKRNAIHTQLFHPLTGKQLHEAPHIEHPGVVLENQDRVRILFQAIYQLPENQKTAFVLCKIEDFSQKETAEIMQLSEKAIEALLRRARENLKKSLGIYYLQGRI